MYPRLFVALLLVSALATSAAVREQSPGLYDHLERQRSGGRIAIQPIGLDELPAADPLRESWSLVKKDGRPWSAWIDERTSLPTLALARDRVWPNSTSLDDHELRARELLAEGAFADGPGQEHVFLDPATSGHRGPNTIQLRFEQRVDGVSVDGARFELHISQGRLVALGSRLWSPVRISAKPSLNVDEARVKLDAYVRPHEEDGVRDVADPQLVLIPVDADPSAKGKPWSGERGHGIDHRLVWRFAFTDLFGVATWTGEVDAHTGEIVAFWDATHYDRIKGHVNPFTDDGLCMDQGCPEPDFPMPYVDFSQDGGVAEYANQHGLYECVGPGTIETTLAGKYFTIDDQCGPISETATCGTELDLGVDVGENCAVAPGASAGNSDAARTSYYHLNMINRKARFWLGPNTWLDDSNVLVRTNAGGSCNASWSGSITLNGAGPTCGNTGQQQGLITHEWGHGMDHNDGGGSDNPGEGYADIVAIIEGRQSCIARGFNRFDNCTGYGDTCLTCTGLREMDWDARASHTPATPTGFLTTFCPNGGGPCGKETHCESHVSSEAIYDLATRDLPAMGIDVDTAWQLTERLWYQSRVGSGGDAYNCTMPNSDSCSAGTWYHQMRLFDDDDGNLTNGTPHAAAIFAAFDRHDIACGASGDPENQNTSSCPSLAAPVATFTAGTNELDVQWGAVTNAANYRVYRNEIGCNRAQLPLAEVSGTSYLDQGLANGLTAYYRVQAIGSNPVCESPVSNCLQAAPQQLAGKVRFDQAGYACDGSIGLEVTDINHPSSTISVAVSSGTESTPENVVLTETPPASASYVGSIPVTTAAPAADGLMSIVHADTITAEYVDLDDGVGGVNVTQQATAFGDCAGPQFLSVQVKDITESTATIEWTAFEDSSGHVEWGLSPALGNVASSPFVQTTHSVSIGPFAECGRVYFRISSTDVVGNASVADASGSPFEFNGATIQGALYEDGFETDLGWTLEGDWEIGPPQGLGSPGDPTVAVEGMQVLGQDLSGQGANSGDYEFNTTRSATSPVIDASAWTDVELRFDRWLNSASVSWAYLYVKDSGGSWFTVWSDTNGHSDVAWTEASYDISAWAAGNPTLQIRFLQNARFATASGWNVDRLVLRDTSVSQFGACGGCAGTPTFAGLVSALDSDPCDSGIDLTWSAAPAWGTGGTGTYAVYRGLTQGFTPSGANLVASGVAGTTWTDTGAPADTPVYYVVRAENDETCSTGPANGGAIDGNAVEVATMDATGGAGSGNVGDTLSVDPAEADVGLSWAAVPGATGYVVERSASAAAGFVVVGSPSTLTFDDPGALNDGQTWYYRVTNPNACN
ncbi:MAG: hypothetical protein OES25_06985 [Acidobacteriota bacterium]|nr:hypothetical protein [Acidobacteriota bacterium]